MRIVSTFLLLFLLSYGIGQNNAATLDSLDRVINHTSSPLEKAKAYISLSELLYLENLDTMVGLCNNARQLCESQLDKNDLSAKDKKEFKRLLAMAYNNLGYVSNKRLSPDSALIYYENAATLQMEVYDMKGLSATVINAASVYYGMNNYSRATSLLDTCEQIVIFGGLVDNRGSLYNTQGYLFAMQSKHQLALDKYNKALSLFTLQNDPNKQAVALNNIARLSGLQDEYEKSVQLYRRSLKLHESVKDYNGMSIVANNIGHAQIRLGEEDSALFYYRKALFYAKKNDYRKQIGLCLENIGSRHFHLNNLDSAFFYMTKARPYKLETKSALGIAYNSKNFAEYYLKIGFLDSAFYYANDALQHSIKASSKTLERHARNTLIKIYTTKGDYKNAYEQKVLHTALYDSIQKKENQKAVLKNQFKMEYEQQLEKERLENENLVIRNDLVESENELRKQQLASMRLWILIFALIVISTAVVIYNRMKNQRLYMSALEADIKIRINEILSLQNKLSEKKNTQLEDVNSILNTPLTEREEEILGLLCEGLTNKEIANKIFLSVNTIKTHIQSLYVKLDVQNRTQAAIKGSELRKV